MATTQAVQREVKRFIIGPEFRKAEENGAWIIEGYASTDAVDSYNEIVDPESFRNTLPRFEQFPVILLNHSWFDKPVGKVLEAEIRPRGLWVKVEISKTAPEVWTLIQEGILKAFSIGFQGRAVEMGADDQPDIWREIELLEISVVNVPANREALFSVASAKGISLAQYTKQSTVPQTTKSEKGAGTMEHTLTKEDVKGVVGEEVKSQLPTLKDDITKSFTEQLTKSAETVGQINQRLSEIAQQVGACQTKSETEQMIDKVQGEVGALHAKLERLSAPGLSDPRDTLPKIKDYTIDTFEKGLAAERNRPVEYVKSTIYTPKQITGNENLQELAARFHQAHDDLLILHSLMAHHERSNYQGPKSLKFFHSTYKPLHDAFRKAMDTATSGEGADWIPTDFSASLMEKMELELVVASKFPSFTMPTSPFKWPFASSFPTAYVQGESTGDSATKYKASTPGTSSITFTAVKMAVRVLSSDEVSEDSIIAILPWLRTQVAKSLARGLDNAIINGDSDGSHQDSNITDPADVATLFNGLRKTALAAAGSKADISTVTADDILSIWKLLGVFGGKPDDLHMFWNIREYITLLGDSAVEAVNTFGPMATILTGGLPKVYGIGVSVSEYMYNNLNASGVYDGSTTTKSSVLIVHKPSFMIGTRRSVRVETDRDIETGQDITVATWRGDFENMQPSQTYPVAIGYNAS